MPSLTNPPPTRLAHRKVLALRARAGHRVLCLDGSVWVTQDGDPRDLVLDAGESFTLDRRGTALVYALADSSVEVHAAPSAPPRVDGLVRRLRDFVGGAAPRSYWTGPSSAGGIGNAVTSMPSSRSACVSSRDARPRMPRSAVSP